MRVTDNGDHQQTRGNRRLSCKQIRNHLKVAGRSSGSESEERFQNSLWTLLGTMTKTDGIHQKATDQMRATFEMLQSDWQLKRSNEAKWPRKTKRWLTEKRRNTSKCAGLPVESTKIGRQL